MNDRVVCVMSVGAGKYRKQYELVRDNLMAYAKKCHADFRFIDDYIDKDKKRDIYSQKLLIPDYLREYEQVLFLDLDIIISPDCPDIFALMPENIGLMAEVNPRSSARFRKIYADNERILNETVEDYFTSRGFAAADGLVGNINGGVLLFRPRLVADLFRDYYMSMKSQGRWHITPRRRDCFWNWITGLTVCRILRSAIRTRTGCMLFIRTGCTEKPSMS